MDRVHAPEAGLALGAGLAPLVDSDLDRTGLGDGAVAMRIGPQLPEIVDLAVGDHGQARVTGIAEPDEGVLAELAGGRTREGAVPGIEPGQQPDIGRGVTAGKGRSQRVATIPDAPGIAELGDQPAHLCPRETGDLLRVAPHQALVGLARAGVAEAA